MKRVIVWVGLLIATLSLMGCHSELNEPTQPPLAATATTSVVLEKIDATHSKGVIAASVVSSGCTSVEHFSVSHQVNGEMCLLEIRRHTPDLCKRASYVTNIKLDWREADCESRQVVFANSPLNSD